MNRFITVVCEANLSKKLCDSTYSFVGLKEEVEATLIFKALNTSLSELGLGYVASGKKPLPNYYNILYSYYVMMGNYRSGNFYYFSVLFLLLFYYFYYS